MQYKFSVIIKDSGPLTLDRIGESQLDAIRWGIAEHLKSAIRVSKGDQSEPLDDPLMFQNSLRGRYRGLDFLVERSEEPFV